MGILDSAMSLMGGSGGTLLGDAFGYDTTLSSYLDYIYADGQAHSDVVKFFYQQLYRDFAPDINGYTLLFMVPPDLSGYRTNLNAASKGAGKESGNQSESNFFDKIASQATSLANQVSGLLGGKASGSMNADNLYSQESIESYMNQVGKIITFAAVDFTPPQSQVNSDSVSSRSGKIPYVTEVVESDQCSVTYIDNRFLDIYMFHHLWLEYMREVVEGSIEPDSSYYNTESFDSENYGTLDYAASLYIVKYRPDLKYITFAAKCVGLFPQGLPSKDLIGTRTSNELTTLSFNYFCTGYREALHLENLSNGFDKTGNVIMDFFTGSSSSAPSQGNWIFNELENHFKRFSAAGESPLFGGFLGGVLNKALGSTGGMLANLSGNAAKLGGIVSNAAKGASSLVNTVKGISDGNTSSIFSYNGPNPFK